jgi:hypothetical protein
MMGNYRGFKMAVIAGACVVLVSFGPARASQEGQLAWSSFSVESPGIGSSGPVTISGRQAATGLTAMTIKAFDRQIALAKPQLDALKPLRMNGMQLSFDTGYKELGGRTLYVQLLSGFVASGDRVEKVLVITERGDIEVTNADSMAAPLALCAEPPAGVAQLASYVDVKVPAKYWVDMAWQDGEWRPAEHLPMPHHHATRLELTNVTELASLAAHRNKRVRITVRIASREVRKVPGRNEWRATYRARILDTCVHPAGR